MRSFLASLLLLVAMVTGTATLVVYLAHETYLDAGRAGEVLAGGLDEPDLREAVLSGTVPGYDRLPAAYRDDVERLTGSGAVAEALEQVEVDASGRVDLQAPREELVRALRAEGRTDVAGRIESYAGDAAVQLPARYLDRYDEARRVAWQVAQIGTLVTAGLVALALVAFRDRRSGLRAVGLAVVACAGSAWLLYRAIPSVAGSLSDSGWVSAAVRGGDGFASDVNAVLLPTAAAGALLLVVAFLVPRPRPYR